MRSRVHAEPLVSEIYDASAEANNWDTFLHLLATAIRGSATSLFLFDTGTMSASIGTIVNMDPLYQRRYSERYSALDGWGMGAAKKQLRQGRVFTEEELWPEDQVPKGEFYSDFLHPLNCFYQFGGIILKQGLCIVPWPLCALKEPDHLEMRKQVSSGSWFHTCSAQCFSRQRCKEWTYWPRPH